MDGCLIKLWYFTNKNSINLNNIARIGHGCNYSYCLGCKINWSGSKKLKIISRMLFYSFLLQKVSKIEEIYGEDKMAGID